MQQTLYSTRDVENIIYTAQTLIADLRAANAQGNLAFRANFLEAAINEAQNQKRDIEAQLTPAQVRETIERAGIGETFTAKAEDVAARVATSRRTIFKWIDNGTPRYNNSVGLLCQLAYEYEVLERPDDGGAVMMI